MDYEGGEWPLSPAQLRGLDEMRAVHEARSAVCVAVENAQDHSDFQIHLAEASESSEKVALSAAVYDPSDGLSMVQRELHVSEDWESANDEDLAAMGIERAELLAPDGFKANIYINRRTGAVVLAFAGTEDRPDVVTDIVNGVDIITAQYLRIAALGRKVSEWAADAGIENLTFVGHSLGGGLAAFASAMNDSVTALTLNAAGVPDKFSAVDAAVFSFRLYLLQTHADLPVSGYIALSGSTPGANVVNFYQSGELLTQIQQDSFLADALGRQIRFPANLDLSPGDRHKSMDSLRQLRTSILRYLPGGGGHDDG